MVTLSLTGVICMFSFSEEEEEEESPMIPEEDDESGCFFPQPTKPVTKNASAIG